MSEEQDPVRQTVRFDSDVYTELLRLARGDEKRPRASFNATVMFVLRAGLRALKRVQEAENEPGQLVGADAW